MKTFRQDIIAQIEQIEEGRIFTCRDLSYPANKLANVAVALSEQSKKGTLVRAERGAYYRPRKSKLGLGILPVYQDEQFRYIIQKLNGYLSGAYIYNKLGLTEQTATTITIATPNPVRSFRFKNLEIECVKAYGDDFNDANTILYLRLLDALKDINHIPGCSPYDVYDRVKGQYFAALPLEELKKMVSLAQKYPPRVRKIVSDMLDELHHLQLRDALAGTILTTTRFELNYKRI